MNCPGHVLIFNKGVRSYRELPLRYGEFGSCHRNEPSGALHGLMRIRGFTQDDGHIFCTEEQIVPECVAYTALVQKVYAHFGFKDIVYKVARAPKSAWGRTSSGTAPRARSRTSLEKAGAQYEIAAGDGVFYGPKIEYHLKDAIGRLWQCGTMQVDFQLPERLGAEYVAADNTRKTPAMLHRATIGSMERFIGIVIEHFGGAFPLWLAPEQVVGAEHHRAPGRVRRKRRARTENRPVSGPKRICETRKFPIKFGNIACKSCPTNWWSATRKSRLEAWLCARAAAKTWGRCPSRL
jgi:threonyl-tRNA synthetase